MAHVICGPCIGMKDVCGTPCVTVCPVDSIHPTRGEPDFASEPQLYIDGDLCVDCAACVDECCVFAILPADVADRRCVYENDEYYSR